MCYLKNFSRRLRGCALKLLGLPIADKYLFDVDQLGIGWGAFLVRVYPDKGLLKSIEDKSEVGVTHTLLTFGCVDKSHERK